MVARHQEETIKKLIVRNKRAQLVEAKLKENLEHLIACSSRVQLADSDHPLYLIEFHPRAQHLHAFSSLNRLYREQSKHEKKTLTADKRLQHAVSESRSDPLTKIANRRALEETLLTTWEQAFHCRSAFSFLMLDLDYFKKINDLYGHPQGDKVLVQISKALVSTVNRKRDFVARFGGEEFSVLLPNTGIDGAKRISENLLVAVRNLNIPNAGSEVADYVTVSIGGYTVNPLSADPDIASVIHFADQALYRAKENGRNRAVHQGIYRLRNKLDE
ncbi:MAG: diguanylate cyclase [Gammaproteobacteria bacterium]